jgi:DNA modification methylase
MEYFMGHFKGIYADTPLDKERIDQNLLNIVNKYKSNPLPWNGQFSPQLVQVLLNYYSKQTDTVFDPFLGSGTTFLEAGELQRQAYGTEINFAAVCLSKIYELINIDFPERIVLINEFENILIKNSIIYSDFFDNKKNDIVLNIKNLIGKYANSKYKILLDCFVILIDFYKDNFSAKWLEMKWHKIKTLVKSLPVSTKKIEALQEDARETSLPDSLFDFVITSPPYINVFNYHQQYRSSSEYLNGSVLPSAKAEIGSNRKNRSNRFNTVTQYCIDMGMVFDEMNRICKNGSQVIFVLGRESQVRKTAFFNGEIVSEIAYKCCNMNLTNRQERVFINRYGMRIYEDILHFKSEKKKNTTLIEAARDIAGNVLMSVIPAAPDESQTDLQDALDSITDIQPSDIFRRHV